MKIAMKTLTKASVVLLTLVGTVKVSYALGRRDGVDEMRRRILMNPEEVLDLIKRAEHGDTGGM